MYVLEHVRLMEIGLPSAAYTESRRVRRSGRPCSGGVFSIAAMLASLHAVNKGG